MKCKNLSILIYKVMSRNLIFHNTSDRKNLHNALEEVHHCVSLISNCVSA